MNFYRLKSIFFIIFSCFILQTAAFAQNNVKNNNQEKEYHVAGSIAGG